MVAVQLISLGILALQSKSYFEEIFYLGSAIGRRAFPDGAAEQVAKRSVTAIPE